MDKNYLDHLTSRIAGLKDEMQQLDAARVSYLRFLETVAPRRELVESDSVEPDQEDRKGLRGRGTARDIFEFLYHHESGIPANMAATRLQLPLVAVTQFYHRYNQQGLVHKEGAILGLTAQGRDLLEKSQPYSGDNPAVLHFSARTRLKKNEPPSGVSPGGPDFDLEPALVKPTSSFTSDPQHGE